MHVCFAGYFRIVLWLFMLNLLLVVNAYSGELRGRVVDAQNSEPLAFVHIVVSGTHMGAMTDIDGNFRLRVPEDDFILKLSYVGYHEREYIPASGSGLCVIKLERKSVQLAEVVVFPGENPAHRIIKNAIQNKDRNNPLRLSTFSYSSYNKLLATLDYDVFVRKWQQTSDSVSFRMMKMLERQHLFLMESVTERMFMYPDLSNELIVGNRVSGVENPIFTMLATELQSFSFYGNQISLLGQNYISPLNPAAFNRYSYHLEDTLFQAADTVFVISYRPAQNTNFDGMEGLLYVHTDGWALQNVIASPAHSMREGYTFRIQQKYEQFNGHHWFPVQLNTDWEFSVGATRVASGLPIRVTGRSYLRDIKINYPARRRDFSNYSVDFNPDANQLSDESWELLRQDSLSPQERNTYHLVDSLGRKHNFDQMLNIVEPIAFGEIPFGEFSLNISDFYRFSSFERHRIGVGGKTNNRFSRRIVAGGFYAWGTGDRQEKYGYYAELVLNKKYDLRLGGGYSSDVFERGGAQFKEKNFFRLSDLIRNIYAGTKDYTNQARAFASWRMLRNYMHVELSASQEKVWWIDDYAYFLPTYDAPIIDFQDEKIGARIRFAWGETFINTPLRVVQLPSPWPVLLFNVTKGFDNISVGDFDYLRLEGRLAMNYPLALLGQQYWVVESGWVSNTQLPWPLLFTARAADRRGLLASPFAFGTMNMNEFVADRYVSIFFQHNLKSLLFRTKRYTPELVLITNAGWGALSHHHNHMNVSISDFRQGYFESGIAINKILPQSWVRKVIFGFSPGVEVLWRYGPYALIKPVDNLSIKLNLLVAF